MLVPDRGDPTTKIGLFNLRCMSLHIQPCADPGASLAASFFVSTRDSSYMSRQVFVFQWRTDRQWLEPGGETPSNSHFF